MKMPRVRRTIRFGVPLLDLAIDDLKTPGLALQIGLASRRIDILTSIDGVEFKDAWPHRQHIEIESLTIPIISRAHLLQNKRQQVARRSKLTSSGLKASKAARK
jgi:hypothetical protein